MSLNRYAVKRDRSEPAILDALTRVGADYLLLDLIDVLVLFRGQLFLLECKTGKGRRTRNQAVLVQRGWPLAFVSSVDDALAAIGLREGNQQGSHRTPRVS